MEGFDNSSSLNPKPASSQQKLQISERVEVRSFEEGFLGSWHPGTVIHCEKLRRYVRYENILNDDGLSNFVEVVTVSSVLDGNFGTPSKRGVIRPLPHLVEFEKCDLKYGLCVDVNYQEGGLFPSFFLLPILLPYTPNHHKREKTPKKDENSAKKKKTKPR